MSKPLLFRVSLFRGIAVHLDGRDISIQKVKAKALLGILALAPTHSERREWLVGLLWSEKPESLARGSLRQVMHALRDVLPKELFRGCQNDRTEVAIEPSCIKSDVADVLASVNVGMPHDLLLDRPRLTETLMAGYEDIDPSFGIWLMAKRQSLHERIARGLEDALRDGRAALQGTYERTARALLNLDPTHEEAARALIRARADAGDIGGAFAVYKALWDLLDSEYDTEPSKPTQDLIAEIRLAQPLSDEMMPAPPPGRALIPTSSRLAPSRLPKLVVSVSDFDASATREGQRYLVHGFRRELLASLVRFREWLVCSPVTALGAPPASGGPEGDYVIDASAFQVADGVRLVLMLRQVATNTYHWSERFQISMENWFDAQQTVVRRLATALNVHLSAERLTTIASRPASDLNAYDLWLRGQATILTFDPVHWRKAEDMFREVIAQMPEFAPAYSSLTQLHNLIHIVLPGVNRDAQRTAQALDFAREAARLDSTDSRSLLALAWSHAMSKEYEQAETYLRLANELNENDPWTPVSSAACFALCGQYSRAQEISERTLRLPIAPSPLRWAYHMVVRFMRGDYAGTLQAAAAAGDINYVPGYKASALCHLGDRDGAARELQRYFNLIRGRWTGKEPASDANIIRWFLYMFPIRRAEDWQRLRDGLAGAGAPVEGLAHHQW